MQHAPPKPTKAGGRPSIGDPAITAGVLVVGSVLILALLRRSFGSVIVPS